MKALVTGLTAQHVGSQRRQIKYEAVTDMFVKALSRAVGGENIRWGQVDPGEDLSEFDVAFVGLVPFTSLTSSYTYGALYAIDQVPNTHLFVDDWQFKHIRSSIGTFVRNPDKLVKPMYEYKKDYGWASSPAGRRTIHPVMERLYEGEFPVAIPAFTWGDRSKLEALPSAWRTYVDISPFCLDYGVVPYPDEFRSRQWVMGTLSDQRQWLDTLGLGWYVQYVGGKASKAEHKVTESDLVAEYGRSWGVLSHPYPHAGSGWWRNRFVHAARTGAVTLADPREVPMPAFDIAGRAGQVETYSAEELRGLADWQRRSLEKRAMTEDEAAGELYDSLVKLTKGGVE